MISGDTVTLTTGGATGTFASRNAGTGITVTVAGLTIGGAQASDYTLTQPTASANITPVALTITAVTNTKTYDATTDRRQDSEDHRRLSPGLGHRQLHRDLRQQERGNQPGPHAERDRQ